MDRLVVLGSVNMDLVARVPYLPAPGETVVGASLVNLPGGKGANQAVAAARLGAEVTLVGRVGNDAYASTLLEHLSREPIDGLAIQRDPDQPSGIAIVLVDKDGQNTVTVIPGSNGRVGQLEVASAISGLSDNGILLLQLEVPREAVRSAIDQARAHGVRIVLNAAPASRSDIDILAGVDVCVLNETEAKSLFPSAISPVVNTAYVLRELHALGVRLAVVTLGADGAAFSYDGETCQLPAPSVAVVDTTGAGDAFVGALCAALLAGCGSTEAVFLATAAGAAATTKSGAQTAFPYPQDLHELFGIDWPGASERA